MSFGSPNGTYCLNFMRYHGASIENTCCHKLLLAVRQSIRIYNHFKVLPIGQSLLLNLTQVQYPLKVKSLCNIIAS